MLETSAAGVPRRRFLTRLGATLAAGVGFSAFDAASAEALQRPDFFDPPSDAQVAKDTQGCAIYCYTHACPGGCCSGKNIFRCVDQCAGTYYRCLTHSCSSYCLSSSAC